MTTVANEHLDPLAQKKKAWSGRFSEPVADFVLRYTASVDFDKRMALADIAGSIAHATMMNKCGVLHDEDLADIKRGMKQIIEEIQSGKFEWKLELEDVHLNVEARLTQLVGDAASVCTRGVLVTTKWPPTCVFTCAKKLTRSRIWSVSFKKCLSI